MDELSKSLFGGKRIFGAFPLSQELAKEQAAARALEKDGTSDGAKKGWETRRGGSGSDVPELRRVYHGDKSEGAEHAIRHAQNLDVRADETYSQKDSEKAIEGWKAASDAAKAAVKQLADPAAKEHYKKIVSEAEKQVEVARKRLESFRAIGFQEPTEPPRERDDRFDDEGDDRKSPEGESTDEDEDPADPNKSVRVKGWLFKDGTSDGAKKGWETRREGGAPEPAPSRSMARRLAIQREPAHHIEGKRLYDDVMLHIEGYKKYADHEDPKLRSAALGPLNGARNKIEELETLARMSNNKQAEGHFQDARAFLEEQTGRGGHSGPSPADAVQEMVAGLDALRGYEARASERSDA